MSRFAEMRKQAGNSAEKLAAKMAESEKFEGGADARYWTLTVDPATGIGNAVIRFLPQAAGEEDFAPFVKIWSHGFKGPTGQWYIEKSLTTMGKPDPVSEHNQKLWATETKENQALVRERKRRLRYVANIYVVQDKAKPENEGKVFLFSFGQKIMDKIKGLLEPEFEDQKSVNAFDLWTGANFRLRAKRVEGPGNKKYPNYDSSEWTNSGPLLDDDESLETIWNAQYKLQDEVGPAQFKSYDELKTRFYQVICEDPTGTPAGQGRSAQKRNETVAEHDHGREEATAAPKTTAAFASKAQASASAAEDDEDMKWFQNLEEEMD
jgi:hypothetical protein